MDSTASTSRTSSSTSIRRTARRATGGWWTRRRRGGAPAAKREAGFDGFTLSDIFEYIDPENSAAIYGRLLDSARPGARFAYWNMLVPRRLAGSFPERTRALESEARELFARDQAFFYSAFVLEEAVA